MTTHPDPLANAWLERVDRLAATLPSHERTELLTDLREHIDAALAARTDDRAVEEVLARLGDPADVVAAAVGATDRPRSGDVSSPPPPPPPAPVHGTTGAEKVTLLFLVLAGVLVVLWPVAVALWIAATILLLTATRWRGGEIGVALTVPIVVAMFGLAPLGMIVVGGSCVSVDGGEPVCTGGPPAWSSLVVVGVLLAAVVAVVLAVRWLARRVDGRPKR